MALEALVGGKHLQLLRAHVWISAPNDYCSVPDVSDRYNNLKAAWDSLVEAANHGHPHGFQVAVTVVLEQLKREQLKKQRKD
jgi:hypothetical protein